MAPQRALPGGGRRGLCPPATRCRMRGHRWGGLLRWPPSGRRGHGGRSHGRRGRWRRGHGGCRLCSVGGRAGRRGAGPPLGPVPCHPSAAVPLRIAQRLLSWGLSRCGGWGLNRSSSGSSNRATVTKGACGCGHIASTTTLASPVGGFLSRRLDFAGCNRSVVLPVASPGGMAQAEHLLSFAVGFHPLPLLHEAVELSYQRGWDLDSAVELRCVGVVAGLGRPHCDLR